MKARGKREAQRNASPWLRGIKKESTESAKYQRQLFRSFRASRPLRAFTRGDAPHVVRRLPLAFISRAFGAADRAGSFRLWRCRSRWLIPPLGAADRAGSFRLWALPIALAHSAFGAADRAGLFRAFGAVHRPRSFRFGAGISDSKPSHALFCCDYSSVQLPDNLVRDLVDVQSSYRSLVLKPLR